MAFGELTYIINMCIAVSPAEKICLPFVVLCLRQGSLAFSFDKNHNSWHTTRRFATLRQKKTHVHTLHTRTHGDTTTETLCVCACACLCAYVFVLRDKKHSRSHTHTHTLTQSG